MANSLGPKSLGMTLLRVVVGIVFVMHGGQKLFFIGFRNVAGFMGSLGIPLPWVSAVVVTLVEFLGGLALILGYFARTAAALLAIVMLVAVLAVHLKHGFFAPAGFEFPLTLLAANLAMLLSGPGALSLDGGRR